MSGGVGGMCFCPEVDAYDGCSELNCGKERDISLQPSAGLDLTLMQYII